MRYLAGAQQDAETEVVDAAVVRHHREPGGAELAQRADRVFGDSAQTEAPCEQRDPGRDVLARLEGGFHDLVQRCLLKMLRRTLNQRP